MEMISVLRYMFPGLDQSMMRGRALVYADRIGRWDAALGAQPTPAEIEAARLPAAKAASITAINAECESRILAVWPATKQLSALAGVYGSAQRTAMETLIAAHIDASNVASDAVTAATTVEAVEAVTVAWPT